MKHNDIEVTTIKITSGAVVNKILTCTNVDGTSTWQYNVGGIPLVVATGTVDAILADYTPDVALSNLTMVAFVAIGANATTTPTFSPDGLTAHTITKDGGQALLVGDIVGAGYVCILEYNLANTRWELLNPANNFTNNLKVPPAIGGTTPNAGTFTSLTLSGLGGAITLPDAGKITLNTTLSTDHTATGEIESLTAGENLVFGDNCYLKSDGKYWKANAGSSTTMPGIRIAIASITANAAGLFLKNGLIRDDSWNWSVLGGYIYQSTTSGALTQSSPTATASGTQYQIVGIAYSTTYMEYNPSSVVIEMGLDIEAKNTGYTITWAELTANPKVFTCESGSNQTFTFVAPASSDVGKKFTLMKTGTGAGSIILQAPATVYIDDGTLAGTVTCKASERSNITFMVVSATQIQMMNATGTWTWS